MSTIWKFPIETIDKQEVKIPGGGLILCVQTQGGNPCLWALVNPDRATETRSIRIHGTGHSVPAAHSWLSLAGPWGSRCCGP